MSEEGKKREMKNGERERERKSQMFLSGFF